MPSDCGLSRFFGEIRELQFPHEPPHLHSCTPALLPTCPPVHIVPLALSSGWLLRAAGAWAEIPGPAISQHSLNQSLLMESADGFSGAALMNAPIQNP